MSRRSRRRSSDADASKRRAATRGGNLASTLNGSEALVSFDRGLGCRSGDASGKSKINAAYTGADKNRGPRAERRLDFVGTNSCATR
jgi:hypothetical protein